jgi:hypothetical protein
VTALPPHWTQDEIARDVAASAAEFRRVRFAEPREKWLEELDLRIAEFEALFAKYGIAAPDTLTPSDLPNIVKDKLLSALRYLPGPPISADDLKALADVESLSATAMRKDLRLSDESRGQGTIHRLARIRQSRRGRGVPADPDRLGELGRADPRLLRSPGHQCVHGVDEQSDPGSESARAGLQLRGAPRQDAL